MLVIDAATIYPRFDRAGALYSLDIIDGATITPLVGEDGRSPEPPDPAFQQILHGVPAADFAFDELLYLPRNPRAHRLYGMSPVEQIALTVNIALRRDAATLEYYRSGSSPDAFATLPKEWTVDQIRQFQDYFDALMSGNSARRRMTKFMPSEFRLIEARQPPLKDMYDEWLARVICCAFSVPASPFVSQVNRATSETLRMQATQEGLVPLKAWVKGALDHVIQICLAEPDLEFVWVGDDAVDPLQQAQTLNILVSAGIKTREEARADLGLGAEGKAGAGVAKYNHYHDERGRFSTAEGAVEPGSGQKPAVKPKGIEVASRDGVVTDAAVGGTTRGNTGADGSAERTQLAGDPREDNPPGANAMAEVAALRLAVLVEDGLSEIEAKIALDALDVLGSPQFAQIEAAYKSGISAEVQIGNYTIVYEPNSPSYMSGMTLFGENGFVVGPRALLNREETSKTILQELYRLRTSKLAGTGYPAGSGSPAARETSAANDFAERAFLAIGRHF